MRIWVHTLVKNEDKFLWYAVLSVIDSVDRVLLWDTGSTDRTPNIVDALKFKYPSKVEVKRLSGEFDEQQLRQKMLEASNCDWIMVVDGDEIWWNESIKKVVARVQEKGDKQESIIVPMIYPVGDIFHYQEKEAGRYTFGKRVGHYALRLINMRIPGLCSKGVHGIWGWADADGMMIQDRDPKKMVFVDAPYMHVTHLERSDLRSKDGDVVKRGMKRKYELGTAFASNFYYPEVFFKPSPNFVESPWQVMDFGFKFRAFFETPLRKINRRVMPQKVGY